MTLLGKNNRLKKLIYIVFALCILLQGAFAFSSESWKVLVYMQADNDLTPYAFWDLSEMEKGLLDNKNIQVFTEIDLPGDEGSFRLEIMPNREVRPNTIEYYSKLNLSQIHSNIISVQAEEMPQEEKLLNFLLWSQETNPTDRTMLVIWGHGEGWSSSQLAQFGGVALDSNPKTRLSINKIRDILKISHDITNEPIEFLSMDACLMQTVEVAAEFSDVVEYVSGSTQIQNLRGLSYTRILKELKGKNLYEFAVSFSDTYMEELAKYASNSDKKIATISVVNTFELKNTFFYNFNNALRELEIIIAKKPILKMTLAYKLKESPAFLGNSRDLSNFIGIVQNILLENVEYKAYDLFDSALAGLKQSIMSYGYGEQYLYNHGYYLGYFKSFGVWFPGNNMDFQNRSRDFENSLFYKQVPAWGDFLFKLFRLIKPLFTFKQL